MAAAGDVDCMVALSGAKRREYALVQPLFWRPAPDADARQRAFFAAQLTRADVLAFVHESEAMTDGFVIATLVTAPRVYDPGGYTCVVDDFAVADPGLWDTVGRALLETALRAARARGAVQSVLVCGQHDEPKRKMLAGLGHVPASEWWVAPLPAPD